MNDPTCNDSMDTEHPVTVYLLAVLTPI